MKYRPDYPDRFGSLTDVRQWVRRFVHWYNQEHYHSALGLLTPAMVHEGRAELINQQRQFVLTQAHAAHPERFVHGQPMISSLPEKVWINEPAEPNEDARLLLPNVH